MNWTMLYLPAQSKCPKCSHCNYIPWRVEVKLSNSTTTLPEVPYISAATTFDAEFFPPAPPMPPPPLPIDDDDDDDIRACPPKLDRAAKRALIADALVRVRHQRDRAKVIRAITKGRTR